MALIENRHSSYHSLLEPLTLAMENIQELLSYSTAKALYMYHPLGRKLVTSPLDIAQGRGRKYEVITAAQSDTVDQFKRTWERMRMEAVVTHVASLSRVYGVSALGVMTNADGASLFEPLDYAKITDDVDIKVYDPLNLTGSFTTGATNMPLNIDFQSPADVFISGRKVDKGRMFVLTNGQPVYLQYSSSGYGFTGFSVFQNCLHSLRLYLLHLQSLEGVLNKMGAIVLKKDTNMSAAGKMIDQAKAALYAIAGREVKAVRASDVLVMDKDDDVASFQMVGVAETVRAALNMIVESVASSASIPAKILMNDGYAGALANGTEDFKQTMLYIESVQRWLAPVYEFLENIVQRVAWNKDFYKEQLHKYPEYYTENGKAQSYLAVFDKWQRGWSAKFATLDEEKEVDKINVQNARFASLSGAYQILQQGLDPENKVKAFIWYENNLNELKELFPTALELDDVALKEFFNKEQQASAPQPSVEDGEGVDKAAVKGSPAAEDALPNNTAGFIGRGSANIDTYKFKQVPKA